jgi:hypothetical protein
MPEWIVKFFYSFPIRLFLLHLRSNLLMIGMWVFLVSLITGLIGRKFGFSYLFLDPEYLSEVNFWSFFLIGLTFGGFLMTWNLTTYLLTAHHFPFLASLRNPFTKFCLNNLLLPIVFLAFYIISIIAFQIRFEGWTIEDILLQTIGLFTGMLSLLIFYFLYFHYTNQDISSYKDIIEARKSQAANITPGRKDIDLDYIKMDANRWRVDNYFNEAFKFRLVRSVAHYDASMLKQIFKQNHLNALIIQLLTMMALFTLGSLMDYSLFRIPAAASLFIMMSVIIAIIGAITYWFDEWRKTIIILTLIAINFFTSLQNLNYSNKAYGLNYEGLLVEYDYKRLEELCLPEKIRQDMDSTIAILNNWKAKNTSVKGKKPKMVLIATSGGGLRAASWTVNVLQTADSLLNGGLLDHTTLITGASGGMLGAGYLRELYLRQQQDSELNLYSREYLDNISKDMLNSVAFTLVSNDLFLPWARFQVGEHSYRKDRGYIFEQQLNENTHNVMNKTLSDYRQAERTAQIPMMFLTPSIVKDARRFIISPQPVSYMMIAPVGLERKNTVEVDAVDFRAMFREQEADSLLFTSALRMSATFPYIMPDVHLPAKQQLEAVDAGFIDNYGLLSATRFIQVFRDWIIEHTSGVVLVQISHSRKVDHIARKDDSKGVIETLFNPIGIAGQIFSLQEFEQDNSLGFIYDLLGDEYFHYVRFIYDPRRDKKLQASISFHLTNREKEVIREEIKEEGNQENLQLLQELLKD